MYVRNRNERVGGVGFPRGMFPRGFFPRGVSRGFAPFQSGLGASTPSTTSKVIGGAAAGGILGAQTALVTGSNLAGAIAGGIATIAPLTGPAAPFVAAAASLVAPLSRLITGCGASCKQATEIVNQAEPILEQLRDEYLNQPTRTATSQKAVLDYMDEVFRFIQEGCGAIGGVAGRNCIAERLVRGGRAPWCPTGTGCDWITVLRDPVANDPGVVPDSVAGGSVDSLGLNFSSVSTSQLAAMAAAGVGLMFLVGGSD